MGLHVRAAEEADLAKIFEIRASAMESDIWRKLIFPTGRSLETTSRGIEAWRAELRQPSSPLYVAVDKSSKVIAFAKWSFYYEPRPEQEWNTQYQSNSAGPEANNDVWYVMDQYKHNMHLRFTKGDPHVYLNYLCTDPASQGTGAGQALMQWGLSIADRDQLPCYLSSTPGAKAFYQRRGFEVLERLELDATQYGLNEVATLDFMRRQPLPPVQEEA